MIKYIAWFVNMGWFVNEFPKYVFLVSKFILKVYVFIYLRFILKRLCFSKNKVHWKIAFGGYNWINNYFEKDQESEHYLKFARSYFVLDSIHYQNLVLRIIFGTVSVWEIFFKIHENNSPLNPPFTLSLCFMKLPNFRKNPW